MKTFFRCAKIFFGPLFPVVAVVCLNLVLLSAFRLGLALWQHERVSAVGGWAELFLQGVRVDFASMGWLMLVPAVVSAFLLADNRIGRVWSVVQRVWLTAGTLFFFFMELSTPAFLATYDFRPNRLFFEYLVSPREVFTMLVNGHLLELSVALVLTAAGAFAFWKFTGWASRDLAFPRWRIRPCYAVCTAISTTNTASGRWWFRPLYAVCAAAVLFIGARSTFGHRPLNPSMVAFSSDAMVNSLAINSGYSVIFSAMQMGDEENAGKIYGKMPLDEVIARVKKMRGRPESDYVSAEQPTLTRNTASVRRERPKNIVVILMESQGAQFIGTLGGLPLSPKFDALAREGWLFEKCFATGTRSVRGIEAVVTGFTPTPARSVVKLGKSQQGFFTVADLLADRGYHTAFIYGGEKHFDNMASFFYGNGFQEIIDQKDYKNPVFTGSWGASDEDLFAMADKKFREWSAAGTPFYSLVFTSSNHDPFEFPDGRIELYDAEKQTRNNAAKYADYALGKFFEAAKNSDYWKDTVFLVVADHDSRVSGAALVPIRHFHVPALILGAGVPAIRDPRLISQIDLAPTMLSLAGIDAEYPMLGFDLTRETPDRALMIYDKNFALMRGDHVAILLPSKPAQGFRYDFVEKKLVPADITEDEARDALAAVLYGSYAYKFDLYKETDKNGNPPAGTH